MNRIVHYMHQSCLKYTYVNTNTYVDKYRNYLQEFDYITSSKNTMSSGKFEWIIWRKIGCQHTFFYTSPSQNLASRARAYHWRWWWRNRGRRRRWCNFRDCCVTIAMLHVKERNIEYCNGGGFEKLQHFAQDDYIYRHMGWTVWD